MKNSALAVLLAGFGCSIGGCGSSGEAVGTTASRSQLACGEMSPIAQAVLSGANSAPSTVSRVGWSYNSVVSGPIIGGQAFADAVTQVVTSAREEVIIESFIIADTWITGQLRNAIARIDPAIPVYVLFTTDETSTINLQTDQTMADKVLDLLDPSRSHNVIVGNWDGRLKINHDKSIVVDRSVLLVSNINMEASADPTWASASGNDWYQMGVILKGEIAGVAASEATSAWTHAGAFATSRPDVDTSAIPTRTSPGGKGCTPMIALGREVGAGEDSSADQGFVSLFTSARRELHVQTPNLNDDGALGALVQATNNADVYLVLSEGFTGWTESIPGQGGSNVNTVQSRLPDLVKGLGDACRLHVRWYASGERPLVAIDGTSVNGASHAKYASADSQFMVIGSQNMDTQSWKVSREFSVGIDDAATTDTFDGAFLTVWNRSACAFECGGCGSESGGPHVGGGGTAGAGGAAGQGGDAGAYAFAKPRGAIRRHFVSAARGAVETVPFAFQDAAGAAPPADLWVEADGETVLQVSSVDGRPFVRAGLNVAPLNPGAEYRLAFDRAGSALAVSVLDLTGRVVVHTTTRAAARVEVLLPGASWRSSIASTAL